MVVLMYIPEYGSLEYRRKFDFGHYLRLINSDDVIKFMNFAIDYAEGSASAALARAMKQKDYDPESVPGLTHFAESKREEVANLTKAIDFLSKNPLPDYVVRSIVSLIEICENNAEEAYRRD